MATIDFTRSCWGHALHGETFRQAKAASRKDRILDKLRRRRRYTVLVHSSRYFQAGDSIRYMTEAGPVTATVAHVRWYYDPKDMAKVEFWRSGDGR